MSKKAAHAAILAEIAAKQAEFKGKDMPTDIGEWIDKKADEAIALQTEIDASDARDKKMASMKSYATEDPLPPEAKSEKDEAGGFLSIGDYTAASDGLKDFIAAGMPKGASIPLVSLPGSLLKSRKYRGMYIPLTAKQVKEVKASPTIGANVIEPMRLPEIARTTEHDRLNLRDVLSVGTTTQNAVRYIRSVYTRAAATVAQGALKPEAGLELTSLLATVHKIAVWMAVDDEQLADLPELSRLINEELLYDLDKHLEEQIMYGDGTGENFDGLLFDADIPVARVEAGDTLIDTFRRMITDVRIAGYEPNAGVVHPLDWESIILEKGSDNRYIWVIVTDGNVQRLWGVPVIETIAVEGFEGDTVEQRNMVVGDWRRGATLWDREQSSIQVGWVNNQFILNQRTILAELRAAFAVRRPKAFVKHQTEAEVS